MVIAWNTCEEIIAEMKEPMQMPTAYVKSSTPYPPPATAISYCRTEVLNLGIRLPARSGVDKNFFSKRCLSFPRPRFPLLSSLWCLQWPASGATCTWATRWEIPRETSSFSEPPSARLCHWTNGKRRCASEVDGMMQLEWADDMWVGSMRLVMVDLQTYFRSISISSLFWCGHVTTWRVLCSMFWRLLPQLHVWVNFIDLGTAPTNTTWLFLFPFDTSTYSLSLSSPLCSFIFFVSPSWRVLLRVWIRLACQPTATRSELMQSFLFAVGLQFLRVRFFPSVRNENLPFGGAFQVAAGRE